MALSFPLVPLIGRSQEAKAVCSYLQQPHIRLLTLTGPGGIGKTRLGTHVASLLHPTFLHGVTSLDVTVLQDPVQALGMLLQAFTSSSVPGISVLEQLILILADKQHLLFLDNLEQVVTLGPYLVELLAACPGIKILITSRIPLHVDGECAFPVPPLATPAEHHILVEQVLESEAVQFLLHYAQMRQPDFQITTANAATIAAICTRLDGIPLALELAAARLKVLPPKALLERLERRLPLLMNDAQDVPRRQKTMRDAIKWSYDLLTEPEQCLFRRLAIFAHGCTMHAARILYNNSSIDADTFFSHITSLIGKNMLQQVSQRAESRLTLLETMREYGLECLEAHGELPLMQRLHADYYLRLAQQAEQHLSSNEQGTWLAQLADDYHNLLVALRWYMAQQAREETAQLCSTLWWYWAVHGAVSEGRYWLSLIVQQREHISPLLRALVLDRAGDLAFHQGDYEQSEQLCQASLAVFRSLDMQRGCAIASWRLGRIAWIRQDYATTQTLAQEALALFEELHDTGGIADTLLLLSYVAHNQGYTEQAQSLAQKSLSLFRTNDDTWGMAYVLLQLARIAFARHDRQAVFTLVEESMALSKTLDYKGGIAISLAFQARMAAEQKQYQQAILLYEESIALLKEMGDQQAIATYQQEQARLQTLLRSERPVTTILSNSSTTAPALLTAREKEVLRLLARGFADAQIAAQLVISPRTVNGHLTAIYRKLHVSSRSEATRYAMVHHLA